MLSIIVPTYNESENVFFVAKQVKEALGDTPYELIFVDDSTDGISVEKLASLSKIDPHVRYEHRTDERGLGTAVVFGFSLATGEVMTVMDADLQHPPEMLSEMLMAINYGADIVIPSRFIPGGDDGGLNFFRKVISFTARYLGKIVLKSVRKINDPTGGFFMFRRDVIKNIELRPVGWKILIEILVRGKYSSVFEIPYKFKARAAGESKMSITEQWNYVRHIIRLAIECPRERRFYAFSLIGFSGVFVNMFVYWLLIARFSFAVAAAGIMSALTAMIINFILNDFITWPDIEVSSKSVRLVKYVVTSTIGIMINIMILSFLYYIFKLNYMLSNLAGIVVSLFWNYTINNKWTWGIKKENYPNVNITILANDI